MPDPVKCPQCGSSDFELIETVQNKCRSCGNLFPAEHILSEAETQAGKKQAKNIIMGVVFMFAVFGYGIWTIQNPDKKGMGETEKEEMMETADENDAAPKYTEITQSFLAVPGKDQTEIWTIKRRNSSNLKEVDYRLSIENPLTRKELYTRPVISTMTWDQSFDKNFQISPIKKAGSRCWLIIGGRDLVGYDIASRQKTVENVTLTTQFHQFAEGISRVDDLNNIAGFKVTSKEGFNYYYLPEDNRVLTEVEYDNVRRNENTNNTSWAFQTQYVFSDGREQQLYKLIRRQQNLRMRKIFPNEVANIVNDTSLWYRKMYNVVSMDEFTPGKIYYNGNVLFYDNAYCVFISTLEANAGSAILVQCLDKNKQVQWSISGNEYPEFQPYLKATNVEAFRLKDELVLQIPYQSAISINVNTGKITWKYKGALPV